MCKIDSQSLYIYMNWKWDLCSQSIWQKSVMLWNCWNWCYESHWVWNWCCEINEIDCDYKVESLNQKTIPEGWTVPVHRLGDHPSDKNTTRTSIVHDVLLSRHKQKNTPRPSSQAMTWANRDFAPKFYTRGSVPPAEALANFFWRMLNAKP